MLHPNTIDIPDKRYSSYHTVHAPLPVQVPAVPSLPSTARSSYSSNSGHSYSGHSGHSPSHSHSHPNSHSHSHSHAHPHSHPRHRSSTTSTMAPSPRSKRPARTYSTSSWDGTVILDNAGKRPCGGTALGSNVKGPCKPIGRTDGVVICWWCSRWLGTFETWTPPRKPPHFESVYDSDDDCFDGFYA